MAKNSPAAESHSQLRAEWTPGGTGGLRGAQGGGGPHQSRSACASAPSQSGSPSTGAAAAPEPPRSSGERSTCAPPDEARGGGAGARFQAAERQLGVSTGESSTKRTLLRLRGAPPASAQGSAHADQDEHLQIYRPAVAVPAAGRGWAPSVPMQAAERQLGVSTGESSTKRKLLLGSARQW